MTKVRPSQSVSLTTILKSPQKSLRGACLRKNRQATKVMPQILNFWSESRLRPRMSLRKVNVLFPIQPQQRANDERTKHHRQVEWVTKAPPLYAKNEA
jgi:hypothetical protein